MSTKSTTTIPVTPKNGAPLPPAFSSPIIGPSVMLELDGSRSPTLATKKGASSRDKASKDLNLASKQQYNDKIAEKTKEASKRPVREKKINSNEVAKQKHASKSRDIAGENSQTFDLRLKGKILTTKSRKSIIEPFQKLSLDEDYSTDEEDIPNPAMHWKHLFQVERQ